MSFSLKSLYVSLKFDDHKNFKVQLVFFNEFFMWFWYDNHKIWGGIVCLFHWSPVWFWVDDRIIWKVKLVFFIVILYVLPRFSDHKIWQVQFIWFIMHSHYVILIWWPHNWKVLSYCKFLDIVSLFFCGLSSYFSSCFEALWSLTIIQEY